MRRIAGIGGAESRAEADEEEAAGDSSVANGRGARSDGSRQGGPRAVTSSSTPGTRGGTLASDEALAALREKRSGGQS